MAAGFSQSEQVRVPAPKQKPQSFCNHISELTFCHLYCILLNQPHSQEEGITQECECQEAGITVGF